MRQDVPTETKAIARIRQRGALLVFPIHNRPEPASLWSEFFPKTPMVWDWNEDGDARVAGMWQLMKRLSQTGTVVYSKWYQGRATFFSRELFTVMLALQRRRSNLRRQLSVEATTVMQVLENNSPLSTKELKRVTGLQGCAHEAEYNRALKELFSKLLIVGFGEFDDGAFPSLAVGATELLFSDLWTRADDIRTSDAESLIERFMPEGSHFRRYFSRSL
jgi:hypothetical protein